MNNKGQALIESTFVLLVSILISVYAGQYIFDRGTDLILQYESELYIICFAETKKQNCTKQLRERLKKMLPHIRLTNAAAKISHGIKQDISFSVAIAARSQIKTIQIVQGKMKWKEKTYIIKRELKESDLKMGLRY